MSGPLSGVRILDMTSVLMGPYATQLLGDMGADVIKVESPSGDTVRNIGPGRNAGMAGVFLQANRSKRSIVLDLKRPEGRDALLRLAATADVMIYNVRPQAMARLGLDHASVAAVNPRILYVGVYGYGQNGPYAAKPAYDDLIQGAVALPSLGMLAGAEAPRYVPSAMADRIVGMSAVNAVTAGLYYRERTGEGQAIEVPMFETMAQFILGDHLGGLSFEPPAGAPGYARLLNEYRRPYETRDGHLCVMLYNDKHWRDFFALAGQPGLMDSDPRFADIGRRTEHIHELYRMVAAIMETRTTAQWREALEQADIPVMPLHTLESLLDDPHLQAVGFFERIEHPSEGRILSMRVPSRWSRSQPVVGRFAPRLGQHSDEILAEAGYDEETIRGLAARGITLLDQD
ncbi:CaiB/BaiF CoA transferase family protein [Metapseudomonas furukawaii]|uniref:CaiB/BaiF CoA transferase family protein n=1 Tax=Metapseudomonas furukawaii TaxID=1149133 RepID=UPI0040457978